VSIALPLLSKVGHDLDKFDRWLRSVLWHNEVPPVDPEGEASQVEIHRTKGRLVFDDGDVMMVQGVREIFEIMDSTENGEGLVGKLVLIGRHIGGGTLEKSLYSALAKSWQ